MKEWLKKMFKTEKSTKNQQYEKYWRITMAYTKFSGDYFNGCLQHIVDYIDEIGCAQIGIPSDQYHELQSCIQRFRPELNEISIRKSINQFLKLGFINNKFKGYHKKTKAFLAEQDISRKKRIYSEILYDNASFSRAFDEEGNINEIHFLIKTLEHCGSISQNELLALMFTDISKYPQGFLTLDELEESKTLYIDKLTVGERKYNQKQYLFSICKNVLAGVYFNKHGNLTLDEPDYTDYELANKNRDPYKQRLYKFDLYEESKVLNSKIMCCYEQYQYPVLIASHIKPYSHCSDEEQFDVNNGLLLSKNMDALFDKGWITFTDQGIVCCADKLDNNIKNILINKNIDKKYFTPERLKYLKYHRDNIFKKDKEYNYN